MATPDSLEGAVLAGFSESIHQDGSGNRYRFFCSFLFLFSTVSKYRAAVFFVTVVSSFFLFFFCLFFFWIQSIDAVEPARTKYRSSMSRVSLENENKTKQTKTIRGIEWKPNQTQSNQIETKPMKLNKTQSNPITKPVQLRIIQYCLVKPSKTHNNPVKPNKTQ